MMSDRVALSFVLALLCLNPMVVFGKSDEAKDKMPINGSTLRDMSQEQQNRQLGELARSIGNLERQMKRVDDRLEKLDRDMKDLRRKV